VLKFKSLGSTFWHQNTVGITKINEDFHAFMCNHKVQLSFA